MFIGIGSSVGGKGHIWMVKNVILQIPNRSLAAYKKKRVAIVQHTHFIRGKQLSSGKLPIGGIAPVSATGLPVGVRVDGFFSEQLGDIFMC